MKLIGLSILSIFAIGFVNAQCSGNEPQINLGIDTVLCQGQTITLSAPVGYDNYTWSNNSTTTFINVSSPGTYTVQGIIQMGNNNLVVNGDFENGNTGFTSDYTYVSATGSYALWDPGNFALGVDPSDYHMYFNSCSDHTSGTGKMYIANGADQANTVIWSQTIAVIPNTNYNFSAWVSSIETTTVPALLQFFVNGIQIGNIFSPSSSGCDWGQFYNLWNSGSNTSAVISIKNQNTSTSGNDFLLDDISFIPYCTNSDTIKIEFDTITVSAGNDLGFCEDSFANLEASSNESTATFMWNTNETNSIISPTISGNYSVIATSINGCSATDSVLVTIYPKPTAEFSQNSNKGIVPVIVEFNNQSTDATIFNWTFGNGLTQTTFDLSSVQTSYFDIGTYEIQLIAINSYNCSDTVNSNFVGIKPVSLEATNVFTPNDDGVNDEYNFRLENISELSILILNRWGNEINEITSPDKGWDGKDKNGNLAIDGVYFYKYSAKSVMGDLLSGQVYIQLIR